MSPENTVSLEIFGQMIAINGILVIPLSMIYEYISSTQIVYQVCRTNDSV